MTARVISALALFAAPPPPAGCPPGAAGGALYGGRRARYQFVYQDINLYTLTYYGRGDERDGD